MKFVMPIAGKTAKELYYANNNGSGGFYPIGANNAYHGGVHFEGNNVVVAIADGTIIAYRYNQNYLEETGVSGDIYKYSNCFVLIRHNFKTPKGQEFIFYSHYNHLSPWGELKEKLHKNEQFPNIIVKNGYEFSMDNVNIRSSPSSDNSRNILSSISYKKGDNVVATKCDRDVGWAKIEGTDQYFNYEGNRALAKDVVCVPEFDKIVSCNYPIKSGAIVGYSGLCMSQGTTSNYRIVHVEVFSGSETEDFVNNARGDGKPTLLKIASGKELYNREKEHDIATLDKITRAKGTIVEIKDEGDGEWVKAADKKFICTVNYDWLNDKYNARVREKHYTVKSEYALQVQEKMPGAVIVGEDPGIIDILVTDTEATHLKFVHRHNNDRTVSLEAAEPVAQYWIKRSIINSHNTLTENCTECYSEDPDAVQVSTAATLSYCQVHDSKEFVRSRGDIWHKIESDEGIGWIKESDLTKVDPFDWQACNFTVIKEQRDDEWSLSGDRADDSQIDYGKLSPFFKNIFDKIDVNHNRSIDIDELRSAMRNNKTTHALSHMICLHQTEWWYDDGSSYYQKIIDKVKQYFGQQGADNLKTRIQHMCWWDSAINGLPSDKRIYHWNPIAFVKHMGLLNGLEITCEQLMRIGARERDACRYIGGINSVIQEFEINTLQKIAYFIAHMYAESASLSLVKEYVRTAAKARSAYGGPPSGGDYRGRGLMQLTGADNYSNYGNYVGVDFTSSTQNTLMLEVSPHAERSAGWYWIHAGLNTLAGENDFLFSVFKVNGGFNGLAMRLNGLKRAINVLGVTVNTDYKFSESKIYQTKKAAFAWGLWHDPNPVWGPANSIFGDPSLRQQCAADKLTALEGYKRFIELDNSEGKPRISDGWYYGNKDHIPLGIREFAEYRIVKLEE